MGEVNGLLISYIMGNKNKLMFESWIWFKIPFLVLFTIIIVMGVVAYFK